MIEDLECLLLPVLTQATAVVIGRLLRSYKMYKQIKNQITNKLANGILRTADNAFIPFDPDNTDYQAYLAWVEEGNTPQPADEVTQ